MRAELPPLRPWRRALHGALLAAAALAVAATAAAYDIIRDNGRIVKWSGGTVTFQIKLGTTPVLQDGSNYSTSFLAAINQWNAVLGSLQLAGNIAAAGPGGDNNGLNEVFFASNVYGEAFGNNTVAITLSYRSSAVQSDGSLRRTQSDIIFNNARSWDSYRGFTQSSTDLRRVAIHELGHSLGLDHPDEAGQNVVAIMNSQVSSVDSLRQDDIDGAQFLYGTPGSIVRPANDAFANAVAITLANNTATVTGSNVNATKEPGEPNHAPNEAGGASVWWRWTAAATGNLAVTTAGSNFDTMLAAYTGAAVGALTQLAANDDEQPPGTAPEATRLRTSLITFPVTAGTTYYLAVDGWEAEWGSINLTLTFALPQPDLAPTISAQPQSQTAAPGATVTFTVTASGRPTPTYQWARNGTAIAGATSPTLTLTNVQAADAGNYTVTVSNRAGSVTSNPATLTVSAPTPAPTPPPPSSGGGGGGGGGAPSLWFLAALAAALLARLRTREPARD